MRRHSEIWTVAGVVRRQQAINPQPAYQRGPVWTVQQKQLLIDSILRDLDVPKLYLREVQDDTWRHEVIDGQQRMRAVWEFRADTWPLAQDCDAVAGREVAGTKYSQLPDEVKDRFDQYELHFVILRDAMQDEVEEMFLRLQNGTTLKAAEKRNAMPGAMGKFVRDLTRHPFFARLPFDNRRFTHDELSAQLMMLELEGAPCDVRGRHLEKMYDDHREFDPESLPAAKARRILGFLARAFPVKRADLKKTVALSLGFLVGRLLDGFVLDGREADFRKWFDAFSRGQEADEAKPEDQREPRSVAFQEHCNRRTTSIDALAYRHEYLATSFLLACPDLERLDRKTMFTQEQRLAIWVRDHGVCGLRTRCQGKRCTDGGWEVEPATAWNRGGKATVANGRLVCADCLRAAYAKAS